MDGNQVCRHCGDELPDGCPAHVTSCVGYAHWRGRQRGDLLDDEESRGLMMLRFYGSFSVALRDGLEEVPDLEP